MLLLFEEKAGGMGSSLKVLQGPIGESPDEEEARLAGYKPRA